MSREVLVIASTNLINNFCKEKNKIILSSKYLIVSSICCFMRVSSQKINAECLEVRKRVLNFAIAFENETRLKAPMPL